MATSLPRLSLPSPSRPIASASPGGRPNPVPVPVPLPGRCSYLRLRRSPAVSAAAASSLPVPSSSPEPGSGIGEALAGVAIFSAATGEPSCSGTCGTRTSWELASVLRDTKEWFDSAGIKLIAVGVATPDKTCILAEHLPFPLECLYADPERKVVANQRDVDSQDASVNVRLSTREALVAVY